MSPPPEATAPEAPAERIHVTRSRANPGGASTEVEGAIPFRSRKPSWLKVPPPGGPTYRKLKSTIGDEGLSTVCEEAACPNIGECWERGTATFMILGDVCTRRCGFCNVQTGKPTFHDPLEPLKVANQVKKLGLQACSDHFGRSRRPARLRCQRFRRRDPLDPPAGPGLQGRDPDPRLPWPGDAAGPRRGRAPGCLQPQRRDGSAALPEGAHAVRSSCARPGC